MSQLKPPVLALAPLHEVTDAAFRETVLSCGAPDVMYTEFTSVDGLSHPAARDRIVRRYLQRADAETNTRAQFWGSDPEKFRDAAALTRELGFAGFDINMGCPDKTVVKHGGGGALINDPERALDIVAAAIEGAGGMPVSVKTRLGFDRDVADTWVPKLAASGIDVLTVHARTVRELSRVPARWARIADLAPAVHERGVLLIGNGDVASREDALARISESGADGAMIGRGIFGNFWFFNPDRRTEDVPLPERLAVLSDLAERFEARYGEFRSISTLRKHVKGLVQGFRGAAEIREQLMACSSASEFRAVASEHA
jgi:nifR3 family TIM-barrel protein